VLLTRSWIPHSIFNLLTSFLMVNLCISKSFVLSVPKGTSSTGTLYLKKSYKPSSLLNTLRLMDWSIYSPLQFKLNKLALPMTKKSTKLLCLFQVLILTLIITLLNCSKIGLFMLWESSKSQRISLISYMQNKGRWF